MGVWWQFLQVCQNMRRETHVWSDIAPESQEMHVTCYTDCAKG